MHGCMHTCTHARTHTHTHTYFCSCRSYSTDCTLHQSDRKDKQAKNWRGTQRHVTQTRLSSIKSLVAPAFSYTLTNSTTKRNNNRIFDNLLHCIYHLKWHAQFFFSSKPSLPSSPLYFFKQSMPYIYFFILKAYSPVNRTGSPQGFSLKFKPYSGGLHKSNNKYKLQRKPCLVLAKIFFS